VPRLKTIWADSAYRGKDLADWCKTVGDRDLEVVGHVPRDKGIRRSTKEVDRRANLRLAVALPADDTE
jgi:hypothetical protein